MLSANRNPTYNLKAVLQETGLKADTLRAWERRYGMPQPQRTAGGHRLYSQRDIDTIKWLVARQQEGMSISRAVDLWHSLEAEGRDPLQASGVAVPRAEVVAVSLPAGAAVADLRQMWVSACLAYDERGAEQILAQASALFPVEAVCLELLQKGLSEIGSGWYRGEVTVQQEHFASELALRRIEALLAATPPPTRGKNILVGCPPEEEHTFSLLLIALFLRRRGWDVLYLGPNVPVARLDSAIDAAKSQLVILSAQQLHTAASLAEVAQFLHQHRVPLGYGGLIFNLLPGVRARIPGYFLGESLDLVPQAVEQLLSSPPPVPAAQAPTEEYRQAVGHFQEHQAQLEAEMWRSLEALNIGPDYLALANLHLAHNIVAALSLGDMDYLGVDIEWVEDVIGGYRIPRQSLYGYLGAYHQAARAQLGERGAPVVRWLGQVVAGGFS